MVALDANTGKQVWKTYLSDEPKPWKKNPNGAQLYGPATGGVWDAPTIDTVRGALYVGTGDAVTPPESQLTDAVVAFDLKTGKILWSYRTMEKDLFMGGCNGAEKGEQCPSPMGPDYDIGNSPILVNLPNGKRALLIGTKSADVVAVDPDNNGALLFRVNLAGVPVGQGRGGRGAIVWGGASDQRRCTTAWERRASARSARRRQDRVGVHRPGRVRPWQRRTRSGADDDSGRGVPGGRRRPAVRSVDGGQGAVEVQHGAAVRDGEQGPGERRRDRDVRARSSWTGWSTSARATPSRAARREAMCCWHLSVE